MFGTMSDQTVYIASSLTDPSDKFTVHAESYLLAQVKLLDKLGYIIIPGHRANEGKFFLCDADVTDVPGELMQSTDMIDALNEALNIAKWVVQDPVTLIGGAVRGGFSIEVQHEAP